MLVSDILETVAAQTPSAPAVWFRGTWHTYGEILTHARRVATFLRRAGLRPGDTVALFLENSPTYIAAHFGIHLAGGVEVSMNLELKAPELTRLLANCESRVLIASHRLLQRIRFSAEEVPSLSLLVVDEASPPPGTASAGQPISLAKIFADDGSDEALPPVRSDRDLATIVYTSGSTGDPKGVMLSHANLVSNARSVATYLGLQRDDRMMVVLPFHYIYGRSLLYTHFLTGGSLILDHRFAFPAAILNTMQQERATCFAGVPSTFAILLHKTDVRQRRFPDLRIVTQAGGGMSPAMQREVAEAFRPARLFVMYGSTEASPRLTYVEPEMLFQKFGAIGHAVPGVEVVVVDSNGQPAPVRQTGEIAARGPNIMLGYWKDPVATNRVLRDGFYYTGDIGFVDEDGYIFLTGRANEMIKTGGNRVSAAEVEAAILGLPGIVEVAVVAVPDDILGEAIKAFVVPAHPDVTERSIQKELTKTLPAYKIPGSVELRASLPKNESGKIMKASLKHQPAPA